MKTYFILDEILIAGYISESNKSLIYKELQIQKDLFDEKEDKNSKKWWLSIQPLLICIIYYIENYLSIVYDQIRFNW